jgi:hypothetical protein
MSEPLSEGDLKEVRDAIIAGRKIEAIKLYREFSGQGLKEAKDAVEEMEKKVRAEATERFPVQQPEHGQQKEAKSSKSLSGVQVGKGCFGVFVGVLATALTLLVVAIWG